MVEGDPVSDRFILRDMRRFAWEKSSRVYATRSQKPSSRGSKGHLRRAVTVGVHDAETLEPEIVREIDQMTLVLDDPLKL